MKFMLPLLLVFGLIASPSFAQTPAPARTDTTNLAAYAGTYTFASGSPISSYTVVVKDGSLSGDAGMGNFKLVKQPKADTFQSTSSYGSIITFIRDATTKAVTGLTLAAQGQELSAVKEK
ncbi:DUF3471 domain-containing protein [Fibrella sp. HMF5335]|uniref:DUF3471 domain-containing protein n=1 Tax=Fibrella rubiginis TaxID=2817060 RepID=A0A939GLQ1_9BACT|nr:DUF3471 domain-containing protein [Fibrella rubiginis]MBO0939120.1 DUF3471 domain-containing protein [Fibrella rubiginis]